LKFLATPLSSTLRPHHVRRFCGDNFHRYVSGSCQDCQVYLSDGLCIFIASVGYIFIGARHIVPVKIFVGGRSGTVAAICINVRTRCAEYSVTSLKCSRQQQQHVRDKSWPYRRRLAKEPRDALIIIYVKTHTERHNLTKLN